MPVAPIQGLVLTYGSGATAPVNVLTLAGAGNVAIPLTAFPQAGVTLECWINTTQTTAGAVLVSYDDQTSGTPTRLWIKTPNALQIGFGPNSISTGLSIAAGGWRHLTVTVAPSSPTSLAVGVYVDGVLAWLKNNAIARAAGAWPSASAGFKLGAGVASEPGYNGQLSELRLWNGVLTASQIVTWMMIRAATNAPGAVLVWPLDAAPPAPAVVTGGSFAAGTPALQFRTNRTLAADWTPLGAGVTYNLTVTAGDNSYHAPVTGLAGPPYDVSSFAINTAYTVAVQGVKGGSVGPAATASTVTIELGQPTLSLSQPATGSLVLAWTPIDQAASYQVTLTPTGGAAAVSSQATTTLDLSTQAFGAQSWTYGVAAQWTSVTGPATLSPAMPAAPALSLVYDQPAAPPGQLTATLTTSVAALPYLIAINQAQTPFATALLAPGVATTSTNVTPSGQGFTATARSVAAGVIGPLSPAATVTAYDMPGPLVTQVNADGTAHTLTASWTAAQGAWTNPTFVAELWTTGASPARLQQQASSTASYMFTDPAIVDNATLQVRVRMVAGNSFGRWSAWAPITVGGLPQVTGLSAASDSSGDVSVAWTALAQAAISYVVRIYGSGVDYSTAPLTAASTTLGQSDTKVVCGTTYSVTVTPQKAGPVYGPASTPVTVKACDPLPTPPGPTTPVSDPIDPATGAFTYANPDLVTPGVMPLVFTTYYAGSWPTPTENPLMPASPLGARWTHAYLTRIVADAAGTYAYVFWGNQNVERYAIPGSVTGVFTPAGAVLGSQLFRAADMTYALTRADASRYTFNADGTLAAAYDRYGNSTALAYAGGQLSTVTDVATGAKLTLAYSGGFLHTVTDQGGRVVTYTVTGGNLTSLVDVCGNPRTFAYTGVSLMQSGVDGNGVTVFSNTYTGAQVTKQQDARAIAGGQQYGTTLGYQNTTQGGVAVVVASGADRAGNAISLTSLQSNGTTIATQTALGQGQIEAVQRSYDGFSNLLSETRYVGPQVGYTAGAGVTTTYTYSGRNCTSEVTPLGSGLVHAISRGFDGNGNKLFEAAYEGPATGFSPGAGNTWSYTYTTNNALQTLTDPLGRTTRLTYTPGAIQGLVQTATDSHGNVTTYTYQGGLVQSVTNALGEVWTYVNDTTGRPKQLTVAAAGGATAYTAVYTYRADNQVETVTVFYAGQTQQQGFVTTYGYDKVGNRTSTTDPTGTLTAYGFDPNNFLSKITYATFQNAIRWVELAYDNNDFLNTQTLTSSAPGAISVVSRWTPDAIGRTLSATDPNGKVYGYATAMIVSGTAPCQTRTTTTWPTLVGDATVYTESTLYDPIGRPLAYTNRNQQTVAIAYTTQTDATTSTLQTVVTTTYPAAGQGQAATTTVAVYDALGRPVSFTDQAGYLTSYAYGGATGAGGVKLSTTTVTDPNLNTRTLGYDTAGRLAQDQIGNGATASLCSYTHDPLGRILTAQQGQGGTPVVTTYSYGYNAATSTVIVTVGRPGGTTGATVQSYDGAGRLVRQVDGAGRTTASTYNPWGGLATYTNGRGQVFSYVADEAGRLKSYGVTVGPTVSYGLDNNGNRLTIAAGGQTVTQTFDTWNRRLTRTGVEGAVIGYAYWPTDQVKTLTYSDKKTVGYGIDNLGRMTTVTDWHTPARVTTYGYTADNRLQSIAYANGATATYGFDNGGRLTGVTHRSAGLILADWQIQYDPLGRASQAATIQPLPPGLPAANHTLVYTVGNQVQTQDGAPAAFDADGDYLGQTSTAPYLGYDAYGRVISAALPNLPAATYGYDPEGLRATWTIGGTGAHGVFDTGGFRAPAVERGDPVRALAAATEVPTPLGSLGMVPRYVSGGPVPMLSAIDRLLEARDASQAIQQRFVWGLGLVAQEDAGGAYHAFHADPVGNSSVLTDAGGAQSDAWVFGAFGEVLANAGATATPFRFGGQLGVADDGLGLLYMRARSYLPAQFRFVQPDFLLGDPLRPQSFNAYAYVAGNPLQAADPLGLDTWKWVLGGLAGGAALLGGLAWLAGGAGAGAGGAGGAIGGGAIAGGGGGGGQGGGEYDPVPQEEPPPDEIEMQPMRPRPPSPSSSSSGLRNRWGRGIANNQGAGDGDPLLLRESSNSPMEFKKDV